MSTLKEAYSVLGLPAGGSLPSILRRYRRLAMVWHPDRMPTESGKQESNEELKKINAAKDLLTKHHQSQEHSESGPCECRAAGASASSGRSERQTRQTKQEAGAQSEQTKPPPAKTVEQTRSEYEQSDRLRWKLARYAAVAYVSLFFFSFFVNCVKHVFIH